MARRWSQRLQPWRLTSASAPSRRAHCEPSQSESSRLFHRLNNQLGVILANAELLESRLADETQRARAGQVVTGALEAIATVQHLRREVDEPAESSAAADHGRTVRPMTNLVRPSIF